MIPKVVIKSRTQCGAIYATNRRGKVFSGTFCVRPDGHEGDHRGTGRQWSQEGKRVSPPTMSYEEVSQEGF